MTKHTPGPWEIDWYVCREGNKELWRVPRSIGPVSVDHNHWAGSHLDCNETDALLIAAAPELLAALIKISYRCPTDSANYTLSSVGDTARAAIAKATKEQP